MAHRLRRALSLSFSLLNHPRYQPKPIPSISTHILSLAMSNPNPNSTVIHSSTQLTQSFTSTSTMFRKTFDPETDEIGPDTVLFEGCDYNHWLITMDFPKDSNLTREQMIETYINTAAQIFGSVEEAKKKIYALSTTTYQGFQVECSEETSEKFKNLPGVVFVLPDSYIDPVNKEYGGDKYVNGEIFPRPPPVHYGRRDNRDRRRRDNYGSPPQQNYGPPPQQQNNRPPPQQPNYGPPPQQPPNYGPPPQQPPNYGPPPQQPPNYGPPPQQPPNYGPPPQQPPNYRPPPQQQPNYGPPPQQQPNYGPPPQQQPNYGPPPQQQPNYGPPPPQQPNYGPPPPQPNYRPPPPQPNYGPPPQHQNYGPPPQQNYGPRPHQNYGPPPQQSYVRQPQQGFGNSPNSPLGQNSGPQESGDQRSFTPPSNAYQGKFDRAEPGKDYPEQRGFPQDATYESSVGGSFEHVPGAQRKF